MGKPENKTSKDNTVTVPPKSRFGNPDWYKYYQYEAERLTKYIRNIESFREACDAAYDPILEYQTEGFENKNNDKCGEKKIHKDEFILPDSPNDQTFEGIVTYLRRFLPPKEGSKAAKDQKKRYRLDKSRLQLLIAILRSAEVLAGLAHKKIEEEKNHTSVLSKKVHHNANSLNRF